MEVKKNITVFLDALKTLQDGIELFYEYKDLVVKIPTDKNERLLTSMRDSLIQRFEYCTDLFWKLIKSYLEDAEKMSFGLISSRGVLREAVKARLLTEEQGNQCMDMVESRNKTSHTYHEILAEEIAHEIPEYYDLMKEIVGHLQDMLAKK
jgi:nucleotidyltransferase substrate binding protein (TIGR01987 family)